jgi:SPP1 gp7 family putative phage head morphogenesis protein
LFNFVRDAKRIESQAALKVKKILVKFRLNAIRRYKSSDPSWITKKELDGIVRILAEAMQEANAKAREQVRRSSKVISAASLLDLGDFFPDALSIVSGFAANINQELQAFTADLVAQGLPTKSAIPLLEEKFAALGVSPKNSFSIENIIRTQTQITYNAAKYEEEQQPYIQDILWGYKYVTTGDERVRPEHASLDGVTLPKDDPFWQRFYPPNGWSCRCTAIPLFSKEKISRPRDSQLSIDPKFAGPPTTLRGIN